MVAAARGPRRRTAFFCPEVRPLAAAGARSATRLLVIMRPVVLLRHKRTQCLRRTHRPRSEAPHEYQLAVVAMDLKNAVPPQNPPALLSRHWEHVCRLRSLGDKLALPA